jgi:hypothetical protein
VADYVTKCRFEPVEGASPNQLQELVELVVHELAREVERGKTSVVVTTHSVSVAPITTGFCQILRLDTPGLLVTAVFRVKRLA